MAHAPMKDFEKEWLEFERECLPPEAPPSQREMAKILFYSGAWVLWRLSTERNPFELPAERVMYVRDIAREIDQFLTEIKKRWQQEKSWFPTHCESCGVPLMGGATVHKEGCAFLAIIRESFPNYQR